MDRELVVKGLIRGTATFLTMSLAPLLLTRIIRDLRPGLEVFANIRIVAAIGSLIAVFLSIREIKREENLGFVAGILGTMLSMLYVIILFSGPTGLGFVRISYDKVTLALNLRKYVFLLLISLSIGALIELTELIKSLRLKRNGDVTSK